VFFEKESISFTILDSMYIHQKNTKTWNTGRNFAALSFRVCSDAVLASNGKEIQTSDGYVAYVPSGVEYMRTASIDELYVVHFDTSDYVGERIEGFQAVETDTLKELFQKLYECWEKREVGYKYRCSAYFYEILCVCYRQNQKNNVKNEKIKGAVEYLEANFKNPNITVSEIAKRSYMSEVYFRKLFRKEYGISPQKYLIKLRLQHAVGLMASGYYTLQEIADMSGYNDYKYFSVEFKKHKGVSPSQYLYIDER